MIDVDETDRSDGRVPVWDATAGTHVYEDKVAGAGVVYVPTAGTTVLNFLNTSAAISQTALELTDLPDDGDVVLAHIAAFCRTTTIANGNSYQVFGYQADRSTPQTISVVTLYGFDPMGTASVYTTETAMVPTGGTNNRSVLYAVNRASGTVHYALRVLGYWTT